MPQLTIEGHGSFEVPEGRRLVKAIEACGVDIGHRCGGKARCTTCRVQFHAGEPDVMTRAEYDKLQERGLLGEVRLSCQLVADRDMHVAPLMRLDNQAWSDTGPEPADVVEPEAKWFPKQKLFDPEPDSGA